MAKGAVENVLAVLKFKYGLPTGDYDIHVNFPGGVPIDGPSAGISIAVAIYSAITNSKVDNRLAMTGEISVHGMVKPVGGVISKIEAARRAGIRRVIIPADNWLKIFEDFAEIEVIPVQNLDEVLEKAIIYNKI
jgi:Lon-like ATP-dependent protease